MMIVHLQANDYHPALIKRDYHHKMIINQTPMIMFFSLPVSAMCLSASQTIIFKSDFIYKLYLDKSQVEIQFSSVWETI